MAGERVRWGVLGAATIAREAFIPALRKGPCAGVAELVALASRDGQRAEQLASELQIPRAYGSYEELLAAPDIDAVYIPLPNHLHVPFAIQALEHGKHVLCEKPLALTPDEAHSLLAATARFPRLKVMEAFMYRFHPQWQWVFRNVQENRLGRLRSIQTHFSFFDDNPTSILHRSEWGGERSWTSAAIRFRCRDSCWGKSRDRCGESSANSSHSAWSVWQWASWISAKLRRSSRPRQMSRPIKACISMASAGISD